MSRFFVLWRKELAQHAWAIGFMAVLLALLGLIVWINVIEEAFATNDLAAAGRTLSIFVPVSAFILGRLVVVREYHGKTQLFVEALPMRRSEFVVAKYSFGLLVLGGLSLALLAAMAWGAGEKEPKPLLIAGSRAIGYVAAWWSVFFALGLLGRLRLAAYIVLGIFVYALEATTAFEIERFGPFALIDETLFVNEREIVPLRALLESAGLAACFFALGLGLSLIREGSVAETLARRASQREKSALTVLLIAAVMVVGVVEQQQERKPFAFSSVFVKTSREADVAVMYGRPELEPYGALVLDHLDRFSKRLRELGVARRPPIRVAHQSILEGSEVREKNLPDADGVLLEANLASPGFDMAAFLNETGHASFTWITDGRAMFEPDHWLLDGFCSWWAAEQVPGSAEPLFLRGLVAARDMNIEPEVIARWEQVMQALNEDVANGLAFTGIAFLSARHGRRAVLELARSRLAQSSSADVLGWLEARQNPIAEHFARVTREPWPEFVRAWRAELGRRGTQAPFAEALRRVPRARAALRVERAKAGADVVYELSGEPAEANRDCALLHTALRPYDTFVSSHLLERHAFSWKARERRVAGRLRGKYGRGQRVLVALECRAPDLGASVRLLAARRDVP